MQLDANALSLIDQWGVGDDLAGRYSEPESAW
jgi:hypothetical protein